MFTRINLFVGPRHHRPHFEKEGSEERPRRHHRPRFEEGSEEHPVPLRNHRFPTESNSYRVNPRFRRPLVAKPKAKQFVPLQA